MDGAAIAFGLASAPGPDWLKDVVPILVPAHLCFDKQLQLVYYYDCIPLQPLSPTTDCPSPPCGSGFQKSPTGSTVSVYLLLELLLYLLCCTVHLSSCVHMYIRVYIGSDVVGSFILCNGVL